MITNDSLGAELCELAAEYAIPGASIAVIRGDEDVQLATVGIASVGTGFKVRPDTLFQIGSITKLWTTALILQLIGDGVLDLDARVGDILGDFAVLDHTATQALTIRHLLTHTGGTDSNAHFVTARGEGAVAEHVRSLRDRPQLFVPGDLTSYDNGGFVVLGRVVEVLTGQPFAEAVQARLLAGLSEYAVRPEDALAQPLAVGTYPHREHRWRVAPDPPVNWGALPTGAGVFASARTTALVLHRLAFGTLVPPILALSAQQPALTRLPCPGPRGLGWELLDRGLPETVLGHDGSNAGFVAAVRVLPSARTTVVVLTNWARAPKFNAAVTDAVLALPGPRTLDRVEGADLARCAGTYARDQVSFEVLPGPDSLHVRATDAGRISEQQWHPVGPSHFSLDDKVFGVLRVEFLGGSHPDALTLQGRVALRQP